MQNTIKEYLLSEGAGQVGFCKLDKNAPYNLSYAISYTIPLSNAIVDSITDAPTHTYFHHYRTVNAMIDRLSLSVGLLLGKQGYLYVPVPASQSIEGFSGLFSHKEAAVKAGIGTIGKSNLFISTKNGPRVRLGTILTNYEFSINENEPKDLCGDCNLCKISCPAMAITGKKWSVGVERSEIFDPAACSEYMKKNFQKIGRGVVCGICMKVCPIGK